MRQASAGVLSLLFGFFAACSGSGPRTPIEPSAHIVSYTQLPALPARLADEKKNVIVLFEIDPAGRVSSLRLVSESGSAEWDKVALDSLRQWRFAPLPAGEPARTRLRQDTIIIRHLEPMVVFIREVSVQTKEYADSLYGLLKTNHDADSLAEAWGFRICEPRPIDITRLPPHVFATLNSMARFTWSPPLLVNDRYQLFQRRD